MKHPILRIAALLCLAPFVLEAQQANVNLDYNPHKNTEGLTPFSAPLNSPEVHDDRTVTFRLNAPHAQTVALNPGAIHTVLELGREPLNFSKGADGIWTLTIGPLPPDIYAYHLRVDDVQMADPNNTYAAFTAMPPYSQLVVHGNEAAYYDARPVPHGRITRHIYTSQVTQGERELYVYTPPGYNADNKYPVLYLVGGSGELLDKYQAQFQYWLVDEYQDTNFSQYLIVRKLAEQHKNVCVVGDDAQSIYSFRGAKIENILNFRNDYPGYHLFKLEQNYRSTRNIVNAANSIIANNKGQIPKVVFSDKEEGEKLKVLQAYSDVEEGYMVVKELQNRRLNATCAYADFAILYRTNAQSRIFEEALRKNNVPYRMYGGLSFYQRKEIKDLLAYLRMVINPRDGEALKRIINYPARGIGKTTMDRLEKAAADNQLSLWEVLTHPELGRVGFNAGTLKKLGAFVQLIKSFERLLPVMNAYELTTEVVAQSGILKDLHMDKSTEGQTRVENLDELLNGVREFTEERIESGADNKLVNFLEEVALLTDMDQGDTEDTDRVTLMTIHSAKGLEFPYVFIAGVEEGLFPSPMSGNSEQGLEEERRLFYVAVTRAEKQVTLSYARSRFKYGEHNFVTPSRFLKDIDPAYLDGVETAVGGRPAVASGARFKRSFEGGNRSAAAKRSFSFQEESPVRKPAFSAETFDDTGGDISVGSRVAHERFGQGEVLSLEGQAPNLKAMIAFDNAGTKQLLLKFAKLRLLS